MYLDSFITKRYIPIGPLSSHFSPYTFSTIIIIKHKNLPLFCYFDAVRSITIHYNHWFNPSTLCFQFSFGQYNKFTHECFYMILLYYFSIHDGKTKTVSIFSLHVLFISAVFIVISKLLILQNIIFNPRAYFYVLFSWTPERFSNHTRKYI